MATVNDERRLIHFFGLARSGNHAVLRWLQAGLTAGGAVAVRYNYVNRPTGDGADDWRSFDPRRHATCDDFGPYVTQPPGIRLVTVVSYEDLPLEDLELPILRNEADFGDAVTRICLLRDVYNYFASRWWRCQQTKTVFHASEQRSLWKQYACEHMGVSNRLDGAVPVSFNRWHADQAYRTELAERLGFESCEDAAREMAVEGGGSSFGGRWGDLRVLERWRILADTPEYVKLFDAEVRQLSAEIFGDITDGWAATLPPFCEEPDG